MSEGNRAAAPGLFRHDADRAHLEFGGEGANGDGTTKITNTKYWMGADVTVCRSTKSRFRDWGRNWELTGGSAEYARVDWEGP